jgi:4'-phosphopantetheinyl transferase
MLPIDQQVKNCRLRRWQDRHAHLYTRLQLMEGLKMSGIKYGGLDGIQFDLNNRPFISEEIDFNISHSDGYAICAIGTGMRIGVDIEFYRELEVNQYRTSMSQYQWNDILSAKSPAMSFLAYWTMKEAVVKADGRGMNISFEDVYFENGTGVLGNMRWFLHEIKIDSGCQAWLACNSSKVEIELIEYLPPHEKMH